MRIIYENHRFFLSILTVDNQVKENIEIWGYTGNTLILMHEIKKQFDSKNIFSPGRFFWWNMMIFR